MKITTSQKHIITMDDGTTITLTADDGGLHIAIKEPDSSKHIGKTVTITITDEDVAAFVDTFNSIVSRLLSVPNGQPYSEPEMAQQDVARLTAKLEDLSLDYQSASSERARLDQDLERAKVELEDVALKRNEYRSALVYAVDLLNGPELTQEQWDAEVKFLSARLA